MASAAHPRRFSRPRSGSSSSAADSLCRAGTRLRRTTCYPFTCSTCSGSPPSPPQRPGCPAARDQAKQSPGKRDDSDRRRRRGTPSIRLLHLRQPEWSFCKPSAHPFLPYLSEVKRARRGSGLIQELVQKLPRVDRIDALIAARRIARKRVHVGSIAQNVAVEEHRTAGVAEA
jgi:hypothetical protein